jgi:gliding motility-associated-like protein
MKKSISVIFFFSTLLLHHYSFSQSCDSIPYQHVYYNKGFHETRVKSFSFAFNKDIYLCGSVNQNESNNNTDGWIMRTTFHGTPLWSKQIGTSANETVNSIRGLKDKGYLFAGATRYNSAYNVGWLARVDSLGNPVWSLELTSANGSLSVVDELDNSDFIAIGTLYLDFKGDTEGNISNISHSTNFIIRFDKNGKIIWQRSFYHNSKETLNKINQISDGNFIVTGNVTDSSLAYILKINQYNGDIIWMNQYQNPKNYNFAHIDEYPDGSLQFKTGNRIYNFTSNGNFKSGSYELQLSSNNKPINNGQILDIGSSGANEIYYANVNPNPVLFSAGINQKVNWAHIYTLNSSGILSLGGGRIFNNNIYLSGSFIADKISDNASDDRMAYLLKAKINGETFCSDVANIEFKIINIPSLINSSYTWTDEGSVTPEYITLYSKNIEPVRAFDCSRDCCNDVVVSKEDEICDNNSYKLPDSNIAIKPGFYTSRFNTLAGCDSIIYTNLSQQKKINVGLTADTCLLNNQPVTFILNGDTSFHYRWQNGSTNTQFTASMPGKYWVTAISSCNAVVDTVTVFANCAQPVFIPSAFTPNNDGLNDIFRIPEINGQHLSSFNIYNRYGQLIFHSDDPAKGWNGTRNDVQQPPGTYIYVVRYFDLTNNPHLLKGTVVLIH